MKCPVALKSLVVLLTLATSGCATAIPMTGTPVAAATLQTASCGAQLTSVDATQAAGTLVVQVVDAQGNVQPTATVQVVGPNEGYHVECLPGANTSANVNGVAKLERMRVGTYRVSAYVANGTQAVGADAFARIEAGKDTTVSLVVHALP